MPESDAERGSRLVRRFAGTYDYDALFAEPGISQALKDSLGDEYSHLVKNMGQLRSPIDIIDGRLAVYGHRNDLPERDESVVCITAHPLRMDVGFFAGNAVTIYSRVGKYEHLSSCLPQWVYLNTHDTSGMAMPPPTGEGEFTFKYVVVRREMVEAQYSNAVIDADVLPAVFRQPTVRRSFLLWVS